MGNALRKTADGPVDGGTTSCAPTPGAALTADGPEYDQKAVRRLIMNRKLAPFYEGCGEARSAANCDDKSSEGSLSGEDDEGPSTGKKRSLFRRRRGGKKPDKDSEPARLETFLTEKSADCPICFMVPTCLGRWGQLRLSHLHRRVVLSQEH